MAVPKVLQQTNSLVLKQRTVERGVVEGSVPGQILFNITVKDIVG